MLANPKDIREIKQELVGLEEVIIKVPSLLCRTNAEMIRALKGKMKENFASEVIKNPNILCNGDLLDSSEKEDKKKSSSR